MNSSIDYAALALRRRSQAIKPALAKAKPGRPAPTIGPGTGAASIVLLIPLSDCDTLS